MASTMALGPAITAVLALLRASVALTTYVGTRVYPNDDGDAPANAALPYVQVESLNETPFNTMGAGVSALKWGSEARLSVRVVSETRSDVQANTISGVVKGALDGQPVTVSGYTSANLEYVSLQPLRDVSRDGCKARREWINQYLVTVHQ